MFFFICYLFCYFVKIKACIFLFGWQDIFFFSFGINKIWKPTKFLKRIDSKYIFLFIIFWFISKKRSNLVPLSPSLLVCHNCAEFYFCFQNVILTAMFLNKIKTCLWYIQVNIHLYVCILIFVGKESFQQFLVSAHISLFHLRGKINDY